MIRLNLISSAAFVVSPLSLRTSMWCKPLTLVSSISVAMVSPPSPASRSTQARTKK